MANFCTYFDHRYLPQGLALYQSLKRNCAVFRLWVLCLDRICFDALSAMKLPSVTPVALEEIEAGDEALQAAKNNRSAVEYYFTLSPSWPLFIFGNFPEVELLTYLDGDLFFFSDPAPICKAIGENSIAIVPHNFSRQVRALERFGKYNVGWISFRRDKNGIACLQWWREKCIEWCYDRCEPDRFADQKYLNHWPELFSGVVELTHKGVNLGPWNLANYRLRELDCQVWVDDQPLIFFHFQGFKRMSSRLFDSNLSSYRIHFSPLLRSHIYEPYLRAIIDAACSVTPYLPVDSQAMRPGVESDLLRALPLPRFKGFRKWGQIARSLLTRTFLIAPPKDFAP